MAFHRKSHHTLLTGRLQELCRLAIYTANLKDNPLNGHVKSDRFVMNISIISTVYQIDLKV